MRFTRRTGRRAIYITNFIESLKYSLKKLLKTRGAFPSEEALSQGAVVGHCSGCEEVNHGCKGLEKGAQLVRPAVRR